MIRVSYFCTLFITYVRKNLGESIGNTGTKDAKSMNLLQKVMILETIAGNSPL